MKRRHVGNAFAVDHGLHVSSHSGDDRLDHRRPVLSRCRQRLLVLLVLHRIRADVLGKHRQGKRRFELLGMTRKTTGLEIRRNRLVVEKVPVAVELQVDLQPLQELPPDALAGSHVAAVTVEHQDVLEAGTVHAANRVKEHRQPTARHRRERPAMTHVVFTDPDVHRRSNQHARMQPFGHLRRHVHATPPVVLHRQVLEMLLGRSHRDDARLQLTPVHSLTELPSRVFSHQHLFVSYIVGHNWFPCGWFPKRSVSTILVKHGPPRQ